MAQQLTSVDCPTCSTTFHGVELDSGLAALEGRPCADCGAILCACCARFACDGCGQTFCQSHAVSIPDGTPRPLQCCAACAEECEVEHCPNCDGTNVHTNYVSFGVDHETGYYDEAAIFTCSDCGASGDAEDLVERPAIARPELVERKQPAAEVARPGAAAKGVA